MVTYKTIDEYISTFPPEVHQILQKFREVINEAAPEATEAISYGIPTFKLNGNLVHFGGYKHHIGFYPGAAGVEAFEKVLHKYEVSKGTIKFPIDKPIPFGLVTKIVKFRVLENQRKITKK